MQVNVIKLSFGFVRPHFDDDDDDFGGGFEMELANMDLDGGEPMIGEGPENQHTYVKWVHFSNSKPMDQCKT